MAYYQNNDALEKEEIVNVGAMYVVFHQQKPFRCFITKERLVYGSFIIIHICILYICYLSPEMNSIASIKELESKVNSKKLVK